MSAVEKGGSGGPGRLEPALLNFGVAINAYALYPPQHPQLVEAMEEFLGALEAHLDHRGQRALALLLVGDDLVVDNHPLRSGALYEKNLVRALRGAEVEALTITRGLPEEECRQLLAALAAGTLPASSPHVQVGHVRVGFEVPPDSGEEEDEEGLEPERAPGEGDALQARLEAARDAFLECRSGPPPSVAPFEALIWDLIDALSRSTRAVLPIAPLRGYDERTFVHSVNVSLLVLAQARSLGVEGHPLHQLGLAGLFHDVGKLKVPLDVLNKPGKLSPEEWALMRRHPDLGMAMLCSMEGSPDIAGVVAYEHHLRYDGEPNYPDLATPRRPSLASRLTSVADTFDAISATRPHQKPFARKAALKILDDRAGAFLDPQLVENFKRLMATAS